MLYRLSYTWGPDISQQIITRISPEAGSGISLQITPPAQSSSINDWLDLNAYELGIRTEISAPIDLDSEPRGLGVEPGVEPV